MKKFYLVIFLFVFVQNVANAQNYKRASVGLHIDSTTGSFHLNDMAVDANGNTYMCGYQVDSGGEYYQTHLLLIKINTAGNFEWKLNFNDVKDSIDEAVALAIDSAGFIYVTGSRKDRYCNICTYNTLVSDLITMKYNAAGNRIWLNRFHSGDSILAAPSAITIGKNGTILITANEKKYNPALGTYISKLLVQRMNKNGKTNLIKRVTDVVGNSGSFDNNYNIVIAGAYDPYHYYLERKPMLLKFDTTGTLLWRNVFDEPNENGNFYYVGCDMSNNIYTNGQTDTIAFYNIPKIVTAKYSSTGNKLWVAKESKGSNTLPHVWGDFKIDAAGNSYLTGYISLNDVNDDWLTAKYNTSGIKKWSRTIGDTLGGSDKPIAIAVDKLTGNVFVSGYFNNKDNNYSIATVGYTSTGDSLFFDAYYKRKSNAFASGIGIDKYGNVYTGGAISLNNNPYGASIVIKYVKSAAPFADVQRPSDVNYIKLFPNPVVSSVNIDFTTTTSFKNCKLIINDVSGNTVLIKQLNSTDKSIHINVDVSSLKTGVYTANITDGFSNVSKTFLKQ